MYVIEQMLPDGPHWYAGIRKREPITTPKGTAVLEGPLWSPYWADAMFYDSKEGATDALMPLLKQNPTAAVLSTDKANNHESRELYTPIPDTCIMRFRFLQRGDLFYKGNMSGKRYFDKPKYVVTQIAGGYIHYRLAEESEDVAVIDATSTNKNMDYVLLLGNLFSPNEQAKN